MKSQAHILIQEKNNKKDPKLKIDDIIRVSKYKNSFAKGYILN